jgi:hypothetical protein
MMGAHRRQGAVADQEVSNMADIVFIVVGLAFFALCVAYTRGLDRLVRASEEGEAAQEATS